MNPQLLVKDTASWSLSCISFPPGDESDKARSVLPCRYLPCNGPPPLCSSLLAPVHTGCRSSLPQAWAAQLSRSLTSLTYLSFISHSPRGQFSVNIGRNSIYYTLHAPIEMLRPAHYNLLQYTMTSLSMHQGKEVCQTSDNVDNIDNLCQGLPEEPHYSQFTEGLPG